MLYYKSSPCHKAVTNFGKLYSILRKAIEPYINIRVI